MISSKVENTNLLVERDIASRVKSLGSSITSFRRLHTRRTSNINLRYLSDSGMNDGQSHALGVGWNKKEISRIVKKYSK